MTISVAFKTSDTRYTRFNVSWMSGLIHGPKYFFNVICYCIWSRIYSKCIACLVKANWVRCAVLLVVGLLFCLPNVQSQEICDNAIDDDGDGLTDLWDDECICEGILNGINYLDVIPNPNLEEYGCCPDNFSQIDCANSWFSATDGTADYNNTCDFVMPFIPISGLLPFPDGEGAVGGYIYQGYSEYPGVCLNGFLEAGLVHTLNFTIGAAIVGNQCPPPNIPTIAITLYGNATCEFPAATLGCPTNGDPDWIALGSIQYTPFNSYQPLEISFTPLYNIYAIAIGGPCVLPNDFPGPGDCVPYLLYDGFSMQVNNNPVELEIEVAGDPCDEDLAINGITNHNGGTWQWYFDNIAMIGENEGTFSLVNNQYQSGTYTVVYTTPDGCVKDSVSLIIPPPVITELEASYCLGSEVICSGTAYSSPGIYETMYSNYLGCDSIVYCTITEILPGLPTLMQLDTCGPVDIQICNDIISTTGLHEIICTDYQGCDSLVVFDLRLMEPIAVIKPTTLLPCQPNASILLDGSFSSINNIPTGGTTYFWSGPPNGILGNTNEATVYVSLPGVYCLTLTFDNNGFYCSDVTCVKVEAANELPDAPLLIGPPSGCPGDTLIFSLESNGPIPTNAYTWLLPPGVAVLQPNDSTLFYIGQANDTTQLCGFTSNDCGTSDTVCLNISTVTAHLTFLAGSTCDPAEAGIFTDSLSNLSGCDSLVVRTIQLAPSHLQMQTADTCDPLALGSDTLWFTNQHGCDSILITTYFLWPSQETVVTEYVCDPAGAGVDTVELINQFGCDSTLIINRIYKGVYQEETQVAICGSGITYTDTLLITGGPCDSLLLTHYDFLPLDTIFQMEYTCDASAAGNNMVHFTNQFGCDSTVYTAVIYAGIDTQFIQQYSCDSALVGIQWMTVSGTYCDTTIQIQTFWSATSIGFDQVYSCEQAGPLTDTLLIPNPGGCDSMLVREYHYNDLAAMTEVIPEHCAGEKNGQVTISNVNGGLLPYEYQINTGAWTDIPVFTSLAPGSYSVTIRDGRGCTLPYPDIIVEHGQVLTVDAGPDQQTTLEMVLTLTAISGQSLSNVQWSALDPLSCATCQQTMLGPVKTPQTVYLSAWNADGCIATDDLLVTLIAVELPKVYIPSSFSPNGDGINDLFTIYGNNQIMEIRNFAVYDRWGNALYSRSNLPVNDPSEGWDGSFREKVLDPGVYIYVVETVLLDGSLRLYKGDVTLLR
jgi:gliding motility-associated-like protein